MDAHRWRFVIMLILSFYAAFRVNSSSSSSSSGQVRGCNGTFDQSFSSNFQSFCYSEPYIMQTYFDTYKSLDDSKFCDFLLHKGSCEIPHEDSNFVPEMSLLHRNITGQGSHRYLSTSIGLHQSLSHFHEVVIIERLPLGVFADPFELQNLRKRGVFRDVEVFGDTNLELPSFRSNRSVVEIHMKIGPEDHENIGISLKLPLHARYQPLEDSGYSRVEFGKPDVFICRIQEEDEGDNATRCLVLSIGRSKSESGSVVWDIPAGIRSHTEIVSVVTFVSAVFSAISILLASVFSSDGKLCKISKQS